MLTNLSIENYALIESLSVNFKNNLSTITGETGTGKSILLGALGLALGKRADLSTLKNSNKKCIIEAHFSISSYDLEPFFDENDIDFEQETIVRREILPSGKSRAFINDTPTTLLVLQNLSEKLIDVHSQHQTLQLSDSSFQFQIIDALANNMEEIESYKRGLNIHKNLTKEFNQFKRKQEKAQEDFEYNVFLFDELNNAQLEINEQEVIEKSLIKLSNVEEIKVNLSNALSLAINEEAGLQSLLASFSASMSKIAHYSHEYQELYERIASLKIEFDDVSSEIENSYESISFNPAELEKLNDRLQLIYNLQKKHNVNSVAALHEILEGLSEKVKLVADSSAILLKKEVQLKEVSEKIDSLSKIIFQKRKKSIPNLIEKLESVLQNLGMSNTSFQMNIKHTDQYFSNGKDELQILISADKGVSFGPIKKVASGGELSRIMLTLKSILSDYLNLPTIIFDEIDSGVSGDISQKMASIMKEMGTNMQVIVITHLPQIAAKGLQHYKVYKESNSSTIETKLKELDEDQRIVEIAEMLEGKNTSQTAIEHAKQLLN